MTDQLTPLGIDQERLDALYEVTGLLPIGVPTREPSAVCTCVCTTEDFRGVDEICADPCCIWGRDPSCPAHGERSSHD